MRLWSYSRLVLLATLRLVPACLLLLQAGELQARPADEARARALFETGKERYRLEAYVGALANFHEALRLVPRSSVLLMIAHAYRRVELPDRALRYYKEYLVAWARERPSQASPHLPAVNVHIAELEQAVEEVKRAEELIGTQPALALDLLKAELAKIAWPRLLVDLALCHEKLGQQAQSLRWIRAAIEFWERFETAWQVDAPNESAPEYLEAQKLLERLRGMERRMQAPRRPGPVAGPADDLSGLPRSRSTLWLVTGISAAILAAGGEVMAWVAFARGNQLFKDDPDLDGYRTMTIVGHVLAGTMAVASGVSFWLYYRSGKPAAPRRASLLLVPGPGGVSVAGWLRF